MLNKFKQSLTRAISSIMTFFRETKTDLFEDRIWLKAIAGFIGLYLIVSVVLGIFWSGEPEVISVQQLLETEAPHSQDGAPTIGAATTLALITVSETLLEKPGGYLSNDVTPPGIWLDNIPNWEYGVLVQIRDLSRVLQESYSRSQSQSVEDQALKNAHAQFSFDHTSWILPATEDEYRRGIKFLRDYFNRLVDPADQTAQFYARADNLRYWLGSVEARLGSLSQKLSASVGQRRINTDLAGDAAAKQSSNGPAEYAIKTHWSQVDDIFYEARGASWALIHFLKAIEIDFADVLEKKNAAVSLKQIIRELEGTQQTLFSPVVLNGSGFGVLANHSLVMANYISRANAALIDLRELLSRG